LQNQPRGNEVRTSEPRRGASGSTVVITSQKTRVSHSLSRRGSDFTAVTVILQESLYFVVTLDGGELALIK